MKKIIHIILALGFLLGACEKIDEPYLVKTGGSGPQPDEKVRKILLEEFTGHLCVNCPEATLLAHDLQHVFHGQLILMVIHAGDLALPGNVPFDADYTTAEGATIYGYYQPIGVPTGLVNRKAHQGSLVLFKDCWEAAVNELIDLPAEAFIEIEAEYEAVSRQLNIHVHTEFLTDISGQLNVTVFITESGIVSAQKNKNASIGPTPEWPDYEHNHMLRASLNGPWGESLAENPTAGTSLNKDFSTVLDHHWEADNCSIIVIITDADTYEVIQAEAVKLN
jgi:hypothetical protein